MENGKWKMENGKWKVIIRDTILFNDDYYKIKHPDVAQTALDPLEHYLLYGEKMGWQPNLYFFQFGI